MTDLRIIQEQASDIAIARGHADNTPEEVYIRLLLEVQELVMSWMARKGMRVHDGVKIDPLPDEYADVFNMILRGATLEGIDLETAYFNKVKKDECKKYVKVV
jgi:NTP pyrophosphatase (non-canonical NTP hydrolase)